MQDIYKEIHREITPLSPEDSFLVFDRLKDDFDFPVHFHPEYELNFILNGERVRRIVGDSMQEIGDIELVLVGPNLYHGWELYRCRNKNIREITIQFHNNLFDNTFLHRRFMKPIKDMFARSAHGILFPEEVSLKVMPKIIRLSALDGMDYFLEFISILYELALSPDQELLSAHTPEYQDFENSDKIKVIYEYVQKNYHEKISLPEVAEMVNMSVVTFNRFIKKRTGKTFVDYVNDTRIGYAARWLIEKDLNISEIAFKCGFNNMANFNRVFKKVKRCTPSQYREEFSGIKKVL